MVFCGSIPIYDFFCSLTFRLPNDLELFCILPWEGGSGWCRSTMQMRNSQKSKWSQMDWNFKIHMKWYHIWRHKQPNIMLHTTMLGGLWIKFYRKSKLVTLVSPMVTFVAPQVAVEACIKYNQCQQEVQFWFNLGMYLVFVWVVWTRIPNWNVN
jgi:hypothetical protein